MQRPTLVGTRPVLSHRRVIIYQLLIALLLLAALEVGARLVFTPGEEKNREFLTVPFVHVPDMGWEKRRNFNGTAECGVHRNFDSQGLFPIDAEQLKENEGSGRRRVIFIGDSNTYGYCVETDSTFVEFADRLLPDFDLINIGVPGYTSYQGYRQLLKYGEIIKPDIVFIAFNFNDRRAVDEDWADGEAAFTKLAGTPTQRVLESSYLFGLVRDFGQRIGLVKHPVDVMREPRADRLRPRVDPKGYRANLVEMVGWARKHHAIPYFILMGDSPNETAQLRRGISRLARKEYSAAIEDLASVANRPMGDTLGFEILARRYLSLAYKETGRLDEAERALLIAHSVTWSHGSEPVLLDVDYNKIMRDVSQEYNVPLIDAKSRLDENPSVFFDSCHFNAEGHKIVGQMIVDVIERGSEHGSIVHTWVRVKEGQER